ncbi:YifB family Mg chelatase-like AAA ATPase [Candidatus Peregrinibacteria bacterium]|jgi:magnesium chelatase family protein|nr:YifB family Mg chelatase-like AAA ATPase [Candidatus Peregrinibacteria bacterium]MBT7736640.1 YifB family Mg chelatase-like AAA ATPase [Candidatus Peregrinibacteria bacterium]
MVGKTYSCTFSGLNCQIVEVQADISNGLPYFSIVGLGDTSVQESKERVRSSIKNSGAVFPQTRKTINLAPAQLKKQGSLLDLPIAVSILIASDQISKEKLSKTLIIGELSLTGQIKKVPGILAITQHAKENGFKRIFLPQENAVEASFIEGIEVYPFECISDLIDYTFSEIELKRFPVANINRFKGGISKRTHFDNIVGHTQAKRALLIAAAGGHNVLLYGAPGCGKTLLCRSFKSILPPMTKDEILETTKIFSISNLLTEKEPLITERPFREVHPTASVASIIGGGTNPKPGEISLAHNGVLFFDEIAEFSKFTLNALRQPLEDREINISRAKNRYRFPSNFTFLATMNPCPCGYKGDKRIPCVCTQSQIRNYQKKLSGPLLDRIDIFLEISKVSMSKALVRTNKEIFSFAPILDAQQIQENRFSKNRINKNSDMSLSHIRKHCSLSTDAQKLITHASQSLNLSNRGYLKVIKLARTIADLEYKEKISENHIAEALQYRKRHATSPS